MIGRHTDIGEFDGFAIGDRIKQEYRRRLVFPQDKRPESGILDAVSLVIAEDIVNVAQAAQAGAVQRVDVGLDEGFLEERLDGRLIRKQSYLGGPLGAGNASRTDDSPLHVLEEGQFQIAGLFEGGGGEALVRLHDRLRKGDAVGVESPMGMTDQPREPRNILGPARSGNKDHRCSAGVRQGDEGGVEVSPRVDARPALIGIEALRADEVQKATGSGGGLGALSDDVAKRVDKSLGGHLDQRVGLKSSHAGVGASGGPMSPDQCVGGLVRRTSIGYARTAHHRATAGRFEMFRFNLRTRLACAALLAVVAAALWQTSPSALATPPEPSARPPRWELKFEVVHDLRLLELDNQYYWFMTYLVTNRTGEDQIFVPNAILATDAGDIVKDGEGVSYEITQRILKLMKQPLLESKNQIIGQLKTGKEYAREGLMVWKAGSLEDVRDVRVFFGGLSSDTQVVENPVTGDDAVVRKHLAREYDCPGDPTVEPAHAVELRKQEWIMR